MNIEEQEFDLNRNEQERDQIIGQAFSIPYNKSGCQFWDLSLEQLQELVEKKFVDPKQRHNNSPTIQELIEVGKLAASEGHTVTYHGCTRSDYGVSLATINIYLKVVTDELAKRLSEFEETASILDFDSERVIAWWE